METSYRKKLIDTTTEEVFVHVLALATGLLVAGLGLQAVSIFALVNVLTISVFYLLFATTANAGSIYIARCIGAKQSRKARRYAWETILILTLLGLLLGLMNGLAGRFVLTLMGANELIDQALTYYLIVSVPCVINALYMALADVLRGFGDTGTPKWAGWICAVLQLMGTILSIHVFSWGLNGVAITQVSSLFLCLIWLGWRARRFIAPFPIRRLTHSQRESAGLRWNAQWLRFMLVHFDLPVILRSLSEKTVWSERWQIWWELMLLAGPMIGGKFSWRMAHLIYQSSLLHLGASYQALPRLVLYLTTSAESVGRGVAEATRLQVSNELGARRYEQAWKAVRHSLLLGLLIATGLGLTIVLIRDWYASYLVSDPHLAKTLSNLLFLGVIEMFLLPFTVILINTISAAKVPKILMACDLVAAVYLMLFCTLSRLWEGSTVYSVYGGLITAVGLKTIILTYWVIKLRKQWLRRKFPISLTLPE